MIIVGAAVAGTTVVGAVVAGTVVVGMIERVELVKVDMSSACLLGLKMMDMVEVNSP